MGTAPLTRVIKLQTAESLRSKLLVLLHGRREHNFSVCCLDFRPNFNYKACMKTVNSWLFLSDFVYICCISMTAFTCLHCTCPSPGVAEDSELFKRHAIASHPHPDSLVERRDEPCLRTCVMRFSAVWEAKIRPVNPGGSWDDGTWKGNTYNQPSFFFSRLRE